MPTTKYELQLTGYDEIDAQHKQLLKWLEKIENAHNHDFGHGVVREMLRNLKSYIVLHFETEERFMRSIGYADIEGHIAEHQTLKRKVEQLDKDFEQSKEITASDFVNMLRGWLIIHINGSDADFAK